MPDELFRSHFYMYYSKIAGSVQKNCKKFDLPLANPKFSCTIVSDCICLLTGGSRGVYVTVNSSGFSK